jgi:hypothetical protein
VDVALHECGRNQPAGGVELALAVAGEISGDFGDCRTGNRNVPKAVSAVQVRPADYKQCFGLRA